jgi:ferredoxin-thioredoxin reductase catalytic chain
MSEYIPAGRDVDALFDRLHKEAEASGYHLNPNLEFTKDLVQGLLVNEKRYGYEACPCRLADGDKQSDLDIICPCDYRDPDLNDYGTCFCKLYVSQAVLEGKQKLHSIPERRPLEEDRRTATKTFAALSQHSLGIWRCKVCGYLCARDSPPEVCSICKAKKEHFEKFEFKR